MIELKKFSLLRQQDILIPEIDVRFETGQFWGVLGRNGLGKTTLLHQITGLLPSASNTVFIDGFPIEQLGIRQRAQRVSYLLQIQEPCLNFSVLEAVAMGQFAWQPRKPDWQAAQQLLAMLHITHLGNRSLLSLSGGERRKVELATCFAQRSNYLLLDEPLNHLDMVYQQFILDYLSRQSEQQAIIMVCHDLAAVKSHCSHVLMLLPGGCYLAGESATILNQKNLTRLFDD